MGKKPGDWWDVSLNPYQGCSRCSEACEHCWALAFLKRFYDQEPGEIRYFWERLDKATTWRRPRHIFIGSLTDVFHRAVPNEELDRLIKLVRWLTTHAPHTCYLLTKRPQRIRAFQECLLRLGKNPHFNKRMRVGITVENQQRLDERWSHLDAAVAPFKWLSIEPLLGPIDLDGVIDKVQWVVVGGENGPGARPMHPQWVRSIRDQCQAAGVPFWFKGWGEWYPRAFMDTDGLGCLTDHWLPKTYRNEWGVLDINGQYLEGTTCWNGCELNPADDYECTVYRVGQKISGRILDGREWSERP